MNIRTLAFEAAKGDSELIAKQAVDFDKPGSSLTENCECYRRYRFDEHQAAFLGFLAVALTLVVFAALLAGLTLAISSLDMTWLQIMSTTGPKRRRRQAEIVSRIKRHASWFLCSMVLASVICMETLPIIVQSLFGTGWIPVLVSTVAIAIFSELLPQYLIPRQALLWSYYCWPFIWTCMWLTGVVSWPLSFVLDRLTLPKERSPMYTTEQLSVLIRLHERQEKHGGHLGPDAGRVARGALDLDSRSLEKSPLLGAFYDNKSMTENTGDLEKAGHTNSDIIVPWSAVKFIRIDDPVNEQFITKIKQLSYSRIPVIGNENLLAVAPIDNGNASNDQRIFGFLHVKTLLGLDFQDSDTEIRVRDLPLYPLPIVRDDLPLYDLLNMFQLGISRMAIVILAPARDWTDNQATATPNKRTSTRADVPLWSSATGVNTRGSLDLRQLGGRVDWITDFLNPTGEDASGANRSVLVTGIRCPAPLGIITFEDIIDTLLQKTSRDEKDFFERRTFDPPTKTRKEGDDNTVRSSRSISRSRRNIPTHASGAHVAFWGNSQGQGTLRRRIPSKATSAMGGTPDATAFGLDGNDERSVSGIGELTADHSSYTENTEGGFHGPSSSADTELSTLAQRNIFVNHRLRRLKGRSVVSWRTVSSPENPTESAFQLRLDILPRHSSCGFAPFIGEVYNAASYEKEVPGLDELPANPEYGYNAEEVLPDALVGGSDQPTASSSFHSSHSDIDARPETSEAASHTAKENATPWWGENTLPRMNFGPRLAIGNIISQDIHPREKSFHDDRSLLPSQWRDIESGDSKEQTARRTSFWI